MKASDPEIAAFLDAFTSALGALGTEDRKRLVSLLALEKPAVKELVEMVRVRMAEVLEAQTGVVKGELITAEEAGQIAGWTASGFKRKATRFGLKSYPSQGSERLFKRGEVVSMLQKMGLMAKPGGVGFSPRHAHIRGLIRGA